MYLIETGYESADAYNNLSAAYIQIEQVEQAEKALLQALELDADHVDAKENLKAAQGLKKQRP